MNQKDRNPDQVWKWDRDHFIHPYTDFSTFKEEGSQIISRAEGMHVFDGEGKSYLDAIGGLWCVNIGHGRKEMADAIASQVQAMQFFNPFGHCTNEPAAELAARLAERAPGDLNHVFFSCSGSAANDTAVRIAHFYFNMLGQPSKKKIISRVDAYHGSTYLAASLTGIKKTKSSFDCLDNGMIHYVSAANMYRAPAGMDESAFCDYLVDEFESRILQLGPETVAAFIAEPIMGAGGVLVAPQDYHRRMLEVCRKYDMLYISDEVVTSFGRLGEMFASSTLFDIEPDIICTAKGLSSGYIPLSATLISDRIYDVISEPQCPGGVFSHGFTYSGHPVACAAALKNIEIIEREDLCGHVRANGPDFLDKLTGLKDVPIVGDVRGSHYMVGIELVSDREQKTGFESAVNSAGRVYSHCLDNGLIVRPIGDLIVLSPPLLMSSEQGDEVVSILTAAIEETQQELAGAGLITGA